MEKGERGERCCRRFNTAYSYQKARNVLNVTREAVRWSSPPRIAPQRLLLQHTASADQSLLSIWNLQSQWLQIRSCIKIEADKGRRKPILEDIPRVCRSWEGRQVPRRPGPKWSVLLHNASWYTSWFTPLQETGYEATFRTPFTLSHIYSAGGCN